MESDLIIITEYIQNSKIEMQFIIHLEEEGLIETRWVEGKQYLPVSQLGDIERYARWYYDLSINVEGIDTIQRLLHQMREMRQELMRLKKILNPYDTNEFYDYEDEFFS